MITPPVLCRHLADFLRPTKVLGILATLALAGAVEARAATFTVLNTDDSGPGSLRQAILDANGSPGVDSITFSEAAAGTIVLATELQAVLEDLDIAGPGSAILTVSGNNAVRVFDFAAGVTATISGLTIANGSAFVGGGINGGQTLTINDCILSGNNAAFTGGGISGVGTLTVNNSILSGNNASEGGAISTSLIGGTIVNSILSDNSASFGGGAILNSGALLIANSTLSENSADLQGGGILNVAAFGGSPGGTLTVDDSTLSGNSAGNGGAIANGGTATINRSTLSDNNAAAGGGGGIVSIGTLVINNSTLSGNTAAGTGGGILNGVTGNGATLIVSYSTMASNTAASGGGLFNERSVDTVTIKSSIVGGNGGGDCANPGGGAFTSLGVNLATDSSCPSFTQVVPGQLDLGPLASNGGPTETHALLSGSLAIDAATDCTDVGGNPVTEDQRTVARPLDGDGTGGAACDVGAYELSASVSLIEIPVLNGRGLTLLALLLAVAALPVLRGHGQP